MEEPVDELGQVWEIFAEGSCAGYSPIYERVSRAVARDRELLDLVREAPPEAHMPTVLLGAVHYLVLGGVAPGLADVYEGRSHADPAPLFRAVCTDHREEILSLLRTRHTQTNECGRSAALGPALTWVASRLPGGLALVDVGASAGLNLVCDRYRLDYGKRGTTGPPDAEVRVSCRIISGDPPIADRLPPIARRVGIDREPVDLTSDDDVRWLLACVWPDTGRMTRTVRAIDAARAAPPPIVRGDAVETLPGVLAGLPADVVPCVTTTWAFAYLSLQDRSTFAEELASAGRRRPVAWVSAEGPGTVELPDPGPPPGEGDLGASLLGVTLFTEKREAITLGYVHPHGAWLDWRA
jgi:hypothetical protein